MTTIDRYKNAYAKDEISLDALGHLVGRALRGDEPSDWRLIATEIDRQQAYGLNLLVEDADRGWRPAPSCWC